MGASQAPGIAQLFTTIICEPLMHIEGIRTYTMIDNIRIAAQSQETFLRAIDMLLSRCRALGVTLNGTEWPDGASW